MFVIRAKNNGTPGYINENTSGDFAFVICIHKATRYATAIDASVAKCYIPEENSPEVVLLREVLRAN